MPVPSAELLNVMYVASPNWDSATANGPLLAWTAVYSSAAGPLNVTRRSVTPGGMAISTPEPALLPSSYTRRRMPEYPESLGLSSCV